MKTSLILLLVAFSQDAFAKGSMISDIQLAAESQLRGPIERVVVLFSYPSENFSGERISPSLTAVGMRYLPPSGRRQRKYPMTLIVTDGEHSGTDKLYSAIGKTLDWQSQVMTAKAMTPSQYRAQRDSKKNTGADLSIITPESSAPTEQPLVEFALESAKQGLETVVAVAEGDSNIVKQVADLLRGAGDGLDSRQRKNLRLALFSNVEPSQETDGIRAATTFKVLLNAEPNLVPQEIEIERYTLQPKKGGVIVVPDASSPVHSRTENVLIAAEMFELREKAQHWREVIADRWVRNDQKEILRQALRSAEERIRLLQEHLFLNDVRRFVSALPSPSGDAAGLAAMAASDRDAGLAARQGAVKSPIDRELAEKAKAGMPPEYAARFDRLLAELPRIRELVLRK